MKSTTHGWVWLTIIAMLVGISAAVRLVSTEQSMGWVIADVVVVVIAAVAAAVTFARRGRSG